MVSTEFPDPTPAEPNREMSPTPLQINISEDVRFKSLVAESGDPDSMATKMLAMDKFQEQFPEDYSVYEEKSIWCGEDGIPDIREDLFFHKVEEKIEAQIDEKLLAIGSEKDNPDDRLTKMAKAYGRVRFETARDAFREYNSNFPEKNKIYTDTNINYNVHLANFDKFAEERVQAHSSVDKFDPWVLGFSKCLVLRQLGERSPKADRQKISREMDAAFIEMFRKRPDKDKDLRRKFEEWIKALIR